MKPSFSAFAQELQKIAEDPRAAITRALAMRGVSAALSTAAGLGLGAGIGGALAGKAIPKVVPGLSEAQAAAVGAGLTAAVSGGYALWRKELDKRNAEADK